LCRGAKVELYKIVLSNANYIIPGNQGFEVAGSDCFASRE
jgi:hypothetical protein